VSALVSVGLPVYNGERYLRDAIESILAQSHRDLELVISDNASTDATEAICREFAARDARVRYERQNENRGAVWNFNRVASLARGEFYMWAAFDDLRRPECVERSLAALRANPAAVMCCTGIALIDENGQPVPERGYVTTGVRPVGATPRERLRALARSTYWYDFYGLIRTTALRRTRGCLDVWGFDVVLLFELLLQGEVIALPEPLFLYRHFEKKTADDAASTLAPASVGGVPVSWGELSTALVEAAWRAELPLGTRLLVTRDVITEFCLHNWLVRGGIFNERLSAAARAWRGGRVGHAAALASLFALVSGRLAVQQVAVRAGVSRPDGRARIAG
jgi:glycosyltransferase involved in cell wall biosynthesis